MSNISSATKLLVCCVFCILQPEPVQLALEVYSYKMEWKDSLIDSLQVFVDVLLACRVGRVGRVP